MPPPAFFDAAAGLRPPPRQHWPGGRTTASSDSFSRGSAICLPDSSASQRPAVLLQASFAVSSYASARISALVKMRSRRAPAPDRRHRPGTGQRFPHFSRLLPLADASDFTFCCATAPKRTAGTGVFDRWFCCLFLCGAVGSVASGSNAGQRGLHRGGLAQTTHASPFFYRRRLDFFDQRASCALCHLLMLCTLLRASSCLAAFCLFFLRQHFELALLFFPSPASRVSTPFGYCRRRSRPLAGCALFVVSSLLLRLFFACPVARCRLHAPGSGRVGGLGRLAGGGVGRQSVRFGAEAGLGGAGGGVGPGPPCQGEAGGGRGGSRP
jgi:hypothetical protein